MLQRLMRKRLRMVNDALSGTPRNSWQSNVDDGMLSIDPLHGMLVLRQRLLNGFNGKDWRCKRIQDGCGCPME